MDQPKNDEILNNPVPLEKNKDQQKGHGKGPGKGKTNNPYGRPKGTANKLSVKTLLKAVETTMGRTFEEQLSLNYKDAVEAKDRSIIMAYDKMLVNKVVADAKLEESEKEDNKPLPWAGD